jgi:hypothetical protein
MGSTLVGVPSTDFSSNFSGVWGKCTGCPVPYRIFTASPFLPTYARLSWSSPSTITLYALTFTGAPSACDIVVARGWASLASDCGRQAVVANVTASSGSSGFTIPAGATLVYLAVSLNDSAPTISTTLSGTQPILGLAVLGSASALLALAVAWRSRKLAPEPDSGPSAPENNR